MAYVFDMTELPLVIKYSSAVPYSGMALPLTMP